MSSGYARLAQADEEEALHPDHHHYHDDYDGDGDPFATPPTLSVSPSLHDGPSRHHPRSSRSKMTYPPTDHPDLNITTTTTSSSYPSRPTGPSPLAASAVQPRGPRGATTAATTRHRANSSGVDIKAINARLERWAEEIASKFKLTNNKHRLPLSPDDTNPDIHVSVFHPPPHIRPYTAEQLDEHFALNEAGPRRLTPAHFERIVDSVRIAITNGVHPTMISQGSSGSYFARNSDGLIVGVFKPKDEEPYASRNPKWTKWIHRNLFPCCFGRACLIPNLSYVSEAAAYVLDTRLLTNLVPYTDIVWLSSKSFFYDFWDRRRAWMGARAGHFPPKIGSFQVFLRGFKDANVFLREHPWPDLGGGVADEEGAKRKRSRRRAWGEACRPSTIEEEEEEEEEEEHSDGEETLRAQHTGYDVVSETPRSVSTDAHRNRPMTPGASSLPPPSPSPMEMLHRRFRWTPALKQAFREELEKLVILDYIMRNTDRGLDNWMVKIDVAAESVSIVSEPLSAGLGGQEEFDREHGHHHSQGRGRGHGQPNHMDDDDDDDDDLNLAELQPHRPVTLANQQYQSPAPPMTATPDAATPTTTTTPGGGGGGGGPHPPPMSITLGAIDNSLSWPWKHPDAWRSFPFGWLFLPVSLIGQPFSQKTRDHFLPLLTSTAWWSGTQTALRKVFVQDADFKESMFARQIAVMKGQAWNVVETLKEPGHGPLELTRRTRVCVWDDLVDVPVAIPLRSREAMLTEELERARAKLRERDGAGPRRGVGPEEEEEEEEEEVDIGAFRSENRKKKKAGEDGSRLDDLLDVEGGVEMPNPEPSRFYPEARARDDGDGDGDDELLLSKSTPPPRDIPRARPTSPQRTGRAGRSYPASRRHLPSYRDDDYDSDLDGDPSTAPASGRPRSKSEAKAKAKARDRDRDRDARDMHMLFNADDLEGDLGYAAAEELERRATRKVIVERLETVQSKNPVFTWC